MFDGSKGHTLVVDHIHICSLFSSKQTQSHKFCFNRFNETSQLRGKEPFTRLSSHNLSETSTKTSPPRSTWTESMTVQCCMQTKARLRSTRLQNKIELDRYAVLLGNVKWENNNDASHQHVKKTKTNHASRCYPHRLG